MDAHVHADDVAATAEMAERLGFTHLALAVYDAEKLKSLKAEIAALRGKTSLILVPAIEIRSNTVKALKAALNKYRELADLVIVAGGDYAVNRAAAEDGRVDIIAHPEFRRLDSGVDHIVAAAAARNGVAIEISFNSLLATSKRPRSHIVGHMTRNVRLCEKFGAPLVITSGAHSRWQMRDPRSLAAIGHILGMSLADAIKAVSETPVGKTETNRKKITGKILFRGVEVE